jgi:cysteinyl-tRNA synthetase
MFFNTLTRQKEIFKPIHENEVRMYSCGPTVYNYVHIGNLRAYIFVDQLRRYLSYKGYRLLHVMNITDVDDKTIRDAKAAGKTLQEFTGFYLEAFLEDLEVLNIERAEIMPRATETIPEMVSLVAKLRDNGFAYEKNGTWYFRIASFPEYGRLARLDLQDLLRNADGRLSDSDEYEKDDARDFALWKAAGEDDDDICWDTELGRGRPGWHIECSAMSTKYLGQPFDIHTGGVDLIFPHHTNEIAQSEACGVRFVNYWLHNEHLLVNGQKMSKSLGNFFTLRDLLAKGYDPMAIRYQLLSVHYRQQLNFTEEALQRIPSTLQRFKDFMIRLHETSADTPEDSEPGKETRELISEAATHFEASMDDDLNISAALGAVFTFMREINRRMDKGLITPPDANAASKLMKRFDRVLGLIGPIGGENVPDRVAELVKARTEARKNKDFESADRIRDELHDMGYVVEDTPEGPRVKKR